MIWFFVILAFMLAGFILHEIEERFYELQDEFHRLDVRLSICETVLEHIKDELVLQGIILDSSDYANQDNKKPEGLCVMVHDSDSQMP